MNSSQLIRVAEDIATSAHAGQFRRDGITPYISHPRNVVKLLVSMTAHKQVSDIEAILTLGWLHDTLEDTEETIDSLYAKGIPRDVLNNLLILTRDPKKSYEEYLDLIASSPIATIVKIADMTSNLNDSPTEQQKTKYEKGLKFLIGKI